jgi:Ca2+-binding EF-hand superfamily protein
MQVKPSLLTLVLVSTAMAAQAADPNSSKAETWAADFKAADANRSGGLSQAELGGTKPQQFADIKKGFAKMDANRDGQVTVAEYVAHKEKQRQTWEAAFKKADLNDSGGLSKVELDAAGPKSFGSIRKNFDAMDANKDGQVTILERNSFTPPKPVASTPGVDWQANFKKADLNDSGGLSLAELGKTPSSQFADLKPAFDKADVNRDGQVTAQEYTDFQTPDVSEEEDTGWASLLKKLF